MPIAACASVLDAWWRRSTGSAQCAGSRSRTPSALFGIPREALEKSVYLVTREGRKYHSFDAVKQVILRLPVAYLAGGAALTKTPWAALPIALFFSPLFQPAGEAGYDWVAANRYFFPGSTCAHMTGPVSMG